MKNSCFTLCFILFALLLFNSSKAQNDFELNYKMLWNNHNIENKVVAKVGNINITAKEFFLNYVFGPAFVKRKPNSKQKYLDFMIYEKLLAIEGYEKQFNNDKEVKLILNDVEGDLSSELYYRKNIWDKINISESDINSAVLKEQSNINIKWIFTKNEAVARNSYISIKAQSTFDSLFNEQFNDTTVKVENRELQTTLFKLERDNPKLVQIISQLKSGEIANPVKVNDGWYILQLVNKYNTPILTESEINTLKEKVKNILIQERADSSANIFVNNLILETNPIIQRKTFNILRYAIASKFLSPEKIDELEIKSANYPSFSKISNNYNDVLIKAKDGNVLIKDFLNWYYTREPYVKFDFSSHKSYDLSLQQIVWRMYRDYLLVKESSKSKFTDQEEIKEELKFWQDKLVYQKVKLELAGSIDFSLEKLKDYYIKNPNNYKDNNGKLLDFETVKDNVKNDYTSDEFRKLFVHKFLALKQKYKITIDDKLLKDIVVDEENNPKAIEVYPVKKGGTFPRIIYPSIDREWQFFD